MQQNALRKTGRLCNFVIISLVILFLSVPGQSEPNTKGKGDTGLTVSVGYISTSGNSETTTGNFKFDYHTKWGHLNFLGYGAYLFTDVTNQATGVNSRDTERLEAGIKTDYALREKSSVFTNLSWKKDIPSGIDHNISLASGYGCTFFDSSQSKLKGGVGLEGFQEETIVEGSHFRDSVLAVYFQVDYRYSFNKDNTLKFGNESRMNLSNNEDYRLSSTLSYISTINHTLALEISYQQQYRNLPVDDKRKSDTTTTINLVFSF